MTAPRFSDSSPGRADAGQRPFAWVAADHPFHRSLAGLADAVAQDPAAQALLRAARLAGAGALQVHTEIKAGRLASGLWMPALCSWSAQLPDPHARLGMRARTMLWDGTDADRTPRWSDLPDDPRLTQVRGWFDQHATLGRARVLRYVPLRRLSFAWQDERGVMVTGHFMRRSRHAQAQRLMARVSTLVELGRPGFVVASAGQSQPELGLHFQAVLPGTSLAGWLAPAPSAAQAATTRDLAQCRSALAQVGRLLARLHGLPGVGGSGLPVNTDLNAQLETARTQLAWIALMQPSCQEALRAISARLHRLPAWQDSDARFCHGDPACSRFQVDGLQLRTTPLPGSGPGAVDAAVPTDPARWAIDDFEHCHFGDPCRDVAMLMASLADDLPGLAGLDCSQPERVERWLAEVGQSCVHAYEDEAHRTLPQDRLIWQSLCAEVHYLALMLKQDRYHPRPFQRRLRHALALCGARAWV